MANSKGEALSKYFDRKGNPITVHEWTALYTEENIRVAASDVGVSGDIVQVSTVWLGLDHSWGDSKPLIFETLVSGGSSDGEMERYSTEAEALKGHERMCATVQAS